MTRGPLRNSSISVDVAILEAIVNVFYYVNSALSFLWRKNYKIIKYDRLIGLQKIEQYRVSKKFFRNGETDWWHQIQKLLTSHYWFEWLWETTKNLKDKFSLMVLILWKRDEKHKLVDTNLIEYRYSIFNLAGGL